MCRKEMAEIRKGVSMSDISGKDSANAWKALVRNLWFRRIAWIALVVVRIAVAAIVGKEVYKWDQNRITKDRT